VQVPLYRHDEVVALGLVRLLMGWPLYLLVGFVTYTVIRRSPPMVAHLATSDSDAPTDAAAEEPTDQS
jgi:hypothetical protein